MFPKSLFALIVSALVVLPAAAQPWAEKMFETTSHDFGTIARGSKAEYEFVLTNLYLKDVHIAGVRASCGCTDVSIKKPWLKTYEQGAIVASVNSRSFLGHQKATITVTFDQPAPATVQLRATVYVQPDVLVEPGSVELGDLERGISVEKTVAVSSTRRSDWKILDVTSTNTHVSGKVVETARQGNRVAYELRVSLDADAPPGYFDDHLMLITNDTQSSQIPVLVRGRVLSPVTASPSSLFLGVVPPGEERTRKVVVRGRKPFRIVSITAECDCFKLSPPGDAAPKPVHLIPVTFTASEKAGPITEKIRFETDLDGAVAEIVAYAVVAQE